MFVGEGDWCSIAHVSRRRGLVLNCSCFQKKGTGAQLLVFLGEGDWCSIAHV